jgi:hypothetical protein
LRLYNQTPVSGRTIEAYRVDRAWTEGTVTWNTSPQPAPAGTAATSSTPATAQYQTWTVTTQVGLMYSGTNDGFILKDQAEDAGGSGVTQIYQSEEGTTSGRDPELVVTWS